MQKMFKEKNLCFAICHLVFTSWPFPYHQIRDYVTCQLVSCPVVHVKLRERYERVMKGWNCVTCHSWCPALWSVWNGVKGVSCPVVSPLRVIAPPAESSMPPLSCLLGICQCQTSADIPGTWDLWAACCVQQSTTTTLLLLLRQQLTVSLLQQCYCGTRRRSPILAHIKIFYLWCRRFFKVR